VTRCLKKRGSVDPKTHKLWSARSATTLALLLATLLCAGRAFGQKPEYEFYYEYRTVFLEKVQEENHWSLTNEQVFEKYAARLKSDGISESEIARRLRLLRTEHAALDADYYSRYYLDRKANFNHAPNRFLMEMVKGLQPGVALDYGMGQGRNSIYLASLGWQVWGFDPAEAGVAIAQRQAKDLGLTLHTAAVPDSEYDFGKERFDLILFSWTMPFVPVQKVLDSLKPGGIVVMECGTDFLRSRNAMLHLFDSLEIKHYEIVRDESDWEGRREVDIIRLVAKKQ
jgi:2-polyprenyl-3-methyl-5-hydroxy-6-metoxy-1,4-benzoquinol methylase